MSIMRVVLCALVALACPEPAIGQQEGADAVALSFDWPVGLDAWVTHHRSQVRTVNGETEESAAGLRYRMQVQDHPAGRLVSYDSFGLVGPTDPGDMSTQALVEQVGAFMPGLVVSNSGEVVEIVGIDRLVGLVRSLLGPMLDSLPAQAGSLRQTFDRLLSQEFLAAKSAEDWNALVGLWVEAELELGAVYELEAEEPIPILPDRTLPYLYQFSFTSRSPCSPSDLDASCVVLEMMSVPDPVAVTELLDAMIGDAARAALGSSMVYKELEIENAVRLLAEPAGLIPHRLEVVQTMAGEVDVPTEGPASFQQRRFRTLSFEYRAPRR